MIKVLFVCHGNICRSTMAESVFTDLVNKKGLADIFYIITPALSTVKQNKKIKVEMLIYNISTCFLFGYA